MTNDRDELVSKTYRELGDTRAPEHLNERILQKATAEVQPGTARGFSFATWTKPLAWAATIGLSLAIVLEMTQVPVDVPIAPTTENPAAQLQEAEASSSDALKRAENMARQRTGANQEAPAEDASAHVQDIAVSSQKVARRAAAPQPALEEVVRSDADTAVVEAKQKLELTAQSASNLPAASRIAAVKESDASTACATETRKSAIDWLDCISELRAAGEIAAADLEYEAYILEFPTEAELNK